MWKEKTVSGSVEILRTVKATMTAFLDTAGEEEEEGLKRTG